MQIKYLGHSAFEIETNGKKILIDPFLIKSPNYNPQEVVDIFVTHGHGDHLGSAIEISKKTGAKITAIFELANYCALKGANSNGINFGGWIEYSWGKAIAVPAFHSSSTPDGIYAGAPCGYIFDIDGQRVYHAGDTCLNSEMRMIGEFYKPDVAILPIGGYYTMDIEQATVAVQFLGSKTIIPMHYNTFDAIKVDIMDFKSKIEKLGKVAQILEIAN
ncbi:MAG: metal-dependent hydrolase [Candidatus Gastranaerophilales bacterium]|nr:metal-dependent hydrolase [Candidatus Gastranaerophilales bacterium]